MCNLAKKTDSDVARQVTEENCQRTDLLFINRKQAESGAKTSHKTAAGDYEDTQQNSKHSEGPKLRGGYGT